MKKFAFILPLLLLASCSLQKEDSFDEIVIRALKNAETQAMLLSDNFMCSDSLLPRSFENNEITYSDSRWWTSGFFGGTLWYLYENNQDPIFLQRARNFTERVRREQYTTTNHDVGFMLYCSFGNALRITGDSTYAPVLIQGARSPATRFNPKVGLIRSWDDNQDKWQYPVIIDNMMNLELLTWANKATTEKSFSEIAVSHANKTMKEHFRPDYSCYHVVSYDTITGNPHCKQTDQGCSDFSAWARGQAWGLYGYTMMYRETLDTNYLVHAQKIAYFLMNHPRMPKDLIPYWDFDAPDIPHEPRDASSAAIMSSALLELSQYVDADLSAQYIDFSKKQLTSLASSDYTAQVGENGCFILKHCVGNMPKNSEINAPLVYADYYYVEALMRYKKLFIR